MDGSQLRLSRVLLENSGDALHGVPISSDGWRSKQFVNLAQAADGFHLATIDTENEPVAYSKNSHKPFSRGRDREGDARRSTAVLRQDADELHHARTWQYASERVALQKAEKIAAIADRQFRFKRKFLQQSGTKTGFTAGLANDEGARGPHVYHVVAAQLFCQDARPDSPVSADIRPSKKNHQRHTRIMEKKANVLNE